MADNSIAGIDAALGYRYDNSSHPHNVEIDVGVPVTSVPDKRVAPYLRPYVGVDFSPTRNPSFYFRAGTEFGGVIYNKTWTEYVPSFSVRPFALTGVQAGEGQARAEVQGGLQFSFETYAGKVFFKTSAGVVKAFSESPLFPTARILAGIEFPLKQAKDFQD